MSENLYLAPHLPKKEQYETLIPQLKALVEGETDTLANLANLCAALHEAFGFLWVGFYRVVHHELVLGTFQGPIACTRIQHGKGVCGSAWQQDTTLVVPDVEQFPGHIACSSRSRSEIVLPVHHQGQVWGVLDIDSEALGTFDQTDQMYLEQIVSTIIEPCL